MKNIQGKTALVTGAGSGIGRAICLELARAGAELLLLDRDNERLEETATSCRVAGAKSHSLVCDLADAEQVRTVAQRLLIERDGVDILVNNAGMVYYGPTSRMTAKQRERLLAVNLHAPIQLTCELLPAMERRLESHIVNVASMYGMVAVPKTSVYHATKFGLLGFTKSLRREYGRHGIGVTAICPGMIRTSLFENGISGHPERDVPQPPAWICGTAQQVAKRTLRAIRRNQRMPVITPFAHLACGFERFAPWLMDWLYQLGRRKKMRQRRAKLAELGLLVQGPGGESLDRAERMDSPDSPDPAARPATANG